jgi:hypothetical protein
MSMEGLIFQCFLEKMLKQLRKRERKKMDEAEIEVHEMTSLDLRVVKGVVLDTVGREDAQVVEVHALMRAHKVEELEMNLEVHIPARVAHEDKD